MSNGQLLRLWHRVVYSIKKELLIPSLFGILTLCSHASKGTSARGSGDAGALLKPLWFLSPNLAWIFKRMISSVAVRLVSSAPMALNDFRWKSSRTPESSGRNPAELGGICRTGTIRQLAGREADFDESHGEGVMPPERLKGLKFSPWFGVIISWLYIWQQKITCSI